MQPSKNRTDEKLMTSTQAGEAVVKEDAAIKDYKEVKVSDVKVDG